MDTEELKKLIEFMNENNLAELEIEEEGRKVRLVKVGSGAREVVAVPAHIPAGLAHAAAVQAAGGSAPVAPAVPPANIHIIKAPMVGTFYSSPSPDSDPFADAGTQVSDDTTVCIIEAMKVMNEIRAEVTGTIVEVLAENGHPVEYGQPLFKVQLAE